MSEAASKISIDEESGVPIWLQLRNRLVYLIESGAFQEGDKLPTVREMAVDLGVNYNTVGKVYQDIERDGYIVSKRGKGTFVARTRMRVGGTDNPEEVLAGEFIRQCKELGVPECDIVGLVQRSIDMSHGKGSMKAWVVMGGERGRDEAQNA